MLFLPAMLLASGPLNPDPKSHIVDHPQLELLMLCNTFLSLLSVNLQPNEVSSSPWLKPRSPMPFFTVHAAATFCVSELTAIHPAIMKLLSALDWKLYRELPLPHTVSH